MLLGRLNPTGQPLRLLAPDDPPGGGGKDDLPPKKDPPAAPTPEEHQKLVTDLKTATEALKEWQGKFSTLKAEVDTQKKSEAESKGDFKSLYETAKGETDQWKEKFTKRNEAFENNERVRELEAALKKEGLIQQGEKVLDLVDYTKMPVEWTNKGRIIVHGVTDQVAAIKKEYPMFFSKTPPKFNSAGGNDPVGDVEDSQLTPAYLVELEMKGRTDKEARKKYDALIPRYMEKRKREQGRV